MACKIPYLDNNYQGDKLKTLRSKHLAIVKDVVNSKLFYRRDGHLQLSMDMTSNTRKQQEEFVDKIPELSVVKSDANKDILSLKVDDGVVADLRTTLPNTNKDVTLQDRIFNGKSQVTVSEALNNIITNSKNPNYRLLAKELLATQFDDIDIFLREKDLITQGRVARGLYHSKYISQKLFGETPYIEISKNVRFRQNNGEATILHEIMHHLSYRKLRDGSKLSDNFIKLLDYVQSLNLIDPDSITKENPEGDRFYGASDYDEFMSELFTNGRFIQALSNLQASSGTKHKNLFEEIVTKLLEFFGIKSNTTLYEEAVAIASQILKQSAEEQNDMMSWEEINWDEDGNILAEFDPDNVSNRENNEFSEFLAKDTKNQEVFLKIVGDIKSKLNNYIELIADGNIDYPSTEREIKLNELKNIKKVLSNNDLTDAVTGISNVITQSVKWIDIIDEEFFGAKSLLKQFKDVQDQDVSTLTDEELEKREVDIAYISKSLNKSKHFLYLFDSLEEFHNELQRGGFIASDKFNTKLRDKALFVSEMTTLGMDAFDIEVNYTILNNDNISLIELKESISKSHFSSRQSSTLSEKEIFDTKLNEIFKNNINNTFSSQMSYSLSKAENIKKQLKDLHYKVTTEWLYPDYDKIQKDLKLKENDVLFLTKEHFSGLLKIADGNEGYIANWLEATIQSKDPVVSVLASKISKAINNAHFTSVTDAQEITKARDESGFNKMSQEDRDREYAQMNNMITVLKEDSFGNPIEIPLTDDREGLILNTIHGDRKYLIQKVKAWKTGKHTSLAAAQKKLINTLLYANKKGEKSLLNDIMDKAVDSEGNLSPKVLNDYLKTKTEFELSFDIRKALFTTNLDGNILENPITFRSEINVLKGEKLESFIKKKVKNVAFKKLYFDKVETAKSSEDILKLLQQNNKSFNKDQLKKEDLNFIFDNSTSNTDVQGFKTKFSNTKSDKSNMLSIKDENGITLYGYKTLDGKFQFGEIYKNFDFDNVSSFYYKKMEFIELTSDYILPLYNGNHKDYFNVLYNKYQEKNKTLGYKRLKHDIIAQVEETGINLKDTPKEAKDLIVRVYDWFNDSLKHIKKAWIDLDEAEEENTDEKKSFEQQYLNGEKVRNVSIRYTKVLEDQSKLEKDLSVSLLGYVSMVNTYQGLKQYDSQIQLARTVIAGDTLLGIERRQSKKRDRKGNVVGRLRGGVDNAFAKQTANNLNEKILEFIDDMVYGESEYAEFDFGFINSKQFEKGASFVTAYSSLAMNVLGAMGNLSNGKVSTYLESIQGEYFDTKTWKKAEYEYIKNMPLHFKDYKEIDLHKKSKIGQLAMMLDAIQGEYLDSFDEQLRMKRFSDIPHTALFFTQSAPEHYIQLTNMIAMLMANKDNTGKSLWDKIEYKDGESIKITPGLQKELLKFQGTLHSVNKRLNGAYSKIDKSRLQRRWFGRMALTFRKYIYQSFKTRFGDERVDIESGNLIRGYVSSYYKELVTDLESNRTFAYKALKVFKQVGRDTARFGLGTVDKLSFGTLGKVIDLNKITGIDKMEYRRMKEAQRYIAEVSLYSAFTFISMALAAMTSDDDDEDKALKVLELLAKRQKADMGAFLPTMVNIPTGNIVPGFASWDFARRLVASPIPAMRVYDNSVSLLTQLTGVDYTDEGVNFTYDDKYEKSGAGYEKGDLKIGRLAQKSIIAPWWQILKLAQADQQLQYLEMVNKNSK